MCRNCRGRGRPHAGKQIRSRWLTRPRAGVRPVRGKSGWEYPVGKKEQLVIQLPAGGAEDLVMTFEESRRQLLELLRSKSVFHGNFTLSSGARSNYYVDCKLTTLDPKGAWLVGQAMHALIRREEKARALTLDAVGGLTMGADPIALAVGMVSEHAR